MFAEAQEATRKDVQRAFGVLQARFAMVSMPSRRWFIKTLRSIMRCCIILHNMINEDERGDDYEVLLALGDAPVLLPRNNNDQSMRDFILQQRKIMDAGVHSQLRTDLVEHVWEHWPAR